MSQNVCHYRGNLKICSACACMCTSDASRRLVTDAHFRHRYVGGMKGCVCVCVCVVLYGRGVDVLRREVTLRLIVRSLYDLSIRVTLRF
jgi:hypothetical protein